MPFQLVIGNKAYSSWSMRPWLLMQELHIPFEEKLVPLFRDETARRLRRLSPSGRVPTLIDGEAVANAVIRRVPAPDLCVVDLKTE